MHQAAMAQRSMPGGPGGKKRNGDISDDELNHLQMDVLPKRESSRRKAKDNSSTKRILQEKMLAGGDEDSDEKDVDLSDSDDDATWTPFKVISYNAFDIALKRYQF